MWPCSTSSQPLSTHPAARENRPLGHRGLRSDDRQTSTARPWAEGGVALPPAHASAPGPASQLVQLAAMQRRKKIEEITQKA